jgi:hypothetical protein
MRALALSCLLLAPLPAVASDFDFDDAVRDLERHLNTPRLRIPLFGLVTAVAWPVYRPMGVKDFKLAIFEDVRERVSEEPPLLKRLGPGWRAVVRVKERHGDVTCIYARDEGNWVRMLLLTLDGSDAVLMQFKLRPSGLLTYVAKTARGSD